MHVAGMSKIPHTGGEHTGMATLAEQRSMAQQTTYTTKYGVITIGTEYRKVDGRWAVRYDGYQAHQPPGALGGSGTEPIHCQGRDDQSRQYDGPSDSRCGFCYIGVGHTEQAHSVRTR
jgi:hypothetical protein